MGNTVTVGNSIVIAYDASPGDFASTTYFDGDILLQAVELNGNASSAAVIVRNGSLTGEILSKFSDTAGTGQKDSFIVPRWCKPFIKASECTLPNGTVIILRLA